MHPQAATIHSVRDSYATIGKDTTARPSSLPGKSSPSRILKQAHRNVVAAWRNSTSDRRTSTTSPPTANALFQGSATSLPCLPCHCSHTYMRCSISPHCPFFRTPPPAQLFGQAQAGRATIDPSAFWVVWCAASHTHWDFVGFLPIWRHCSQCLCANSSDYVVQEPRASNTMRQWVVFESSFRSDTAHEQACVVKPTRRELLSRLHLPSAQFSCKPGFRRSDTDGVPGWPIRIVFLLHSGYFTSALGLLLAKRGLQ